MNKKIIGIIAVIVAIVVAIVCVVALGDKDTGSKNDDDKKSEAREDHVALDPSKSDARSKTCLANQREIVSQLNMFAMSNYENEYVGTITYTSDGEGYSDFYSDVEGLDEETFCSLFQNVPVCPSCGSYEITLTPADIDIDADVVTSAITVECIDDLDGAGHSTSDR